MHRRAATIILLVRHAEKPENNDPNPNLTDTGEKRARALARIAEEAGVSAIFATEFCRTAQTAQPTAIRLGLPIQVQPNAQVGDQLANCDPPLSATTQLLQVTGLAQHILQQHSLQVVLAVGHSNTVPQLAAQLGADPLCPVFLPFDDNGDCLIPEREFNHLFAIIVPQDGSPVEVTHKLYGE
jgi:broad specificity phosphatase PhoE